jgi:hypothetical protein
MVLARLQIFRENFRGALKTLVKVHRNRPVCWHFCWHRRKQSFTVNSAIPNERIERALSSTTLNQRSRLLEIDAKTGR